MRVKLNGESREVADGATVADLTWLRSRGLDRAVLDHADAGRPILGICGGFQMLGRAISDPEGIEGVRGAEIAGLGLLDVTTTFAPDKVLRLHDRDGYEIHLGRVELGDVDEFIGGARDRSVFGTMHHGTLEDDDVRRAFLADAAALVGRDHRPSSVSFALARAARLDQLGDLAEKHLDVDALLAMARDGAPDVPLLPPGSAT